MLYLAKPCYFYSLLTTNHYKLPQAACKLAQTRFNKQIMHPVSPDWEAIPKVCSKSWFQFFLVWCTLLCTLKFLKLCKKRWETQALKIRVRKGSVPLLEYSWLIPQFRSRRLCYWSCCLESWDQIQEHCCMQSLKTHPKATFSITTSLRDGI